MTYLVHVGYPRAASGFLQKCIFDTDPRMRRITNHENIFTTSGAFDHHGTRASIDNIGTAEVAVLSNPRWVDHPLDRTRHWEVVADRIKATLPEAKILFVMRDAESHVISTYAEYRRDGGRCSFDKFLAGQSFAHGYYQYEEVVTRYVELFGVENVLLLPSEALAAQTERFVKALYDFVGIAPLANVNHQLVNASDYYAAMPFVRRLLSSREACGKWHAKLLDRVEQYCDGNAMTRIGVLAVTRLNGGGFYFPAWGYRHRKRQKTTTYIK